MSTPFLPAAARMGLTPQSSPNPSLPTTPTLSRRNSLDGKREAGSPTPPGSTRRTGGRVGLPAPLIVLGWIALSTAVIFQNREILVGKHFNYPVTLTTLHLAFQSIATRLLHRFTILISGPVPAGEYASVPLKETGEEEHEGGSDKAALERWKRQSVEMDWETWTREILPIACLFSLSLVLSNAAYLYCSVAFIHILKSFSPVAILLAAFIFRTKAFSCKLLGIVLIISAGVGIASYGEVAFSTVGFTIQMVAIAIEATRVTLIQLLLNNSSSSASAADSSSTSSTSTASVPTKPKSSLSMSPLKSLYFLAPVCLTLNSLFLLLLEGRPALLAVPQLGLWTVLSNCSLTFGLNLSAVMLIGLSAMVLSLSKVVKDVLLVISPALLLGESLTPTQVVGYSIATVGLLVYKFSPN